MTDIVKLRQRVGLSLAMFAVLFSASICSGFDRGAAVTPIELTDIPGFKPFTLADLPNLDDETEGKVTKNGLVNLNGLVSTINYETFKKRQPEAKEDLIELAPQETGFARPISVRLFTQPASAPLAVILLGFGQQSNDRLARAWQTYLYNSGCHVLCFDSLIRNNMNEATGHGVAGNFLEESKITGTLVDATLAHSRKDGALKDRVTSVRFLGTSYGGMLALQCLRLPQAKSWPCDRCLALSMPLNMGTASKRLDTFAREDKAMFGKLSLMKLLGGFTPKNETPTPQEESLMRAGLGYVFHGDLHDLAKSNIKRYDPDLPSRLEAWQKRPDQQQMEEDMMKTLEERQESELKALEQEYAGKDKKEYEHARDELKARHKIQRNVSKREAADISQWNFQDYVFLLLKPYWKLKRGTSTPVTMTDLISGAPNFVQAFVAADDPLNDPAELAEFQQKIPSPQLVVMPHGGHLGYTGTRWAETLVEKFFAASSSNK